MPNRQPTSIPVTDSSTAGPAALVLGRTHAAAGDAGSRHIARGHRPRHALALALPGGAAGRDQEPITLGEGCTPLVQQDWGELRPFFKLEWFNPTGSFKDRGSAVMLSFLRAVGVERHTGGQFRQWRLVGGGVRRRRRHAREDPRAGLDVAGQDRAGPRLWRRRCSSSRARARSSEAEAIRQSSQIFYASHNWQPFFLRAPSRSPMRSGKISAFARPDNVIVPVGAGSNLLGCAFGFPRAAEAPARSRKLPRLFAAQPLNCSPIDASFKAGVDTPVAREVNKTDRRRHRDQASAAPARDHRARLRESGGGTVALTEDEIVAALRRLARQGLFAEPTSASAAAALDKLSATGAIRANETTVVVLTGTGLKAATIVADLVQ